EDRSAVLHGSVDHVGVARDPADIGGAPVDIVVVQIEDVLRCDVGLDRVAAGCVHQTFGFAGRAGGVEDVERIFGVERLGRTVCGRVIDDVVPPPVSAFNHVDR